MARSAGTGQLSTSPATCQMAYFWQTLRGLPVTNSDFAFFDQGAPVDKKAGAFDSVLRRAAAMKLVSDRVHACLPPTLAPHVSVSSLIAGELTLSVGSSVWKAKLRLSEPQIREGLSAEGVQVTHIKTVIRAQPLPLPEPKSRLRITPAAAAAFATANEVLQAEPDPDSQDADSPP